MKSERVQVQNPRSSKLGGFRLTYTVCTGTLRKIDSTFHTRYRAPNRIWNAVFDMPWYLPQPVTVPKVQSLGNFELVSIDIPIIKVVKSARISSFLVSAKVRDFIVTACRNSPWAQLVLQAVGGQSRGEYPISTIQRSAITTMARVIPWNHIESEWRTILLLTTGSTEKWMFFAPNLYLPLN